ERGAPVPGSRGLGRPGGRRAGPPRPAPRRLRARGRLRARLPRPGPGPAEGLAPGRRQAEDVMSWAETYRGKVPTAAEAVKAIPSGGHVWIHAGCNNPEELVLAMVARAGELR